MKSMIKYRVKGIALERAYKYINKMDSHVHDANDKKFRKYGLKAIKYMRIASRL